MVIHSTSFRKVWTTKLATPRQEWNKRCFTVHLCRGDDVVTWDPTIVSCWVILVASTLNDLSALNLNPLQQAISFMSTLFAIITSSSWVRFGINWQSRGWCWLYNPRSNEDLYWVRMYHSKLHYYSTLARGEAQGHEILDTVCNRHNHYCLRQWLGILLAHNEEHRLYKYMIGWNQFPGWEVSIAWRHMAPAMHAQACGKWCTTASVCGAEIIPCHASWFDVFEMQVVVGELFYFMWRYCSTSVRPPYTTRDDRAVKDCWTRSRRDTRAQARAE